MVRGSPSARRRNVLLALLAVEAVLAGALGLHDARTSRGHAPDRVANQALAHHLQLTGLALWSEASYARHPCLSDLFTPLSSHPGALEHLPAGSLVPPDRTLLLPRRPGAKP